MFRIVFIWAGVTAATTVAAASAQEAREEFLRQMRALTSTEPAIISITKV